MEDLVDPLTRSYGDPPALVAGINAHLYGATKRIIRPVDVEAEEEVEIPHHDFRSLPVVLPTPPTPAAPAFPPWVFDFLDRVETPVVPVGIRINGVGLNFKAAAIHQEGGRVCMFLTGGMHCELPLSDEVELTVGGETFKVAYFGQWHKFDFLPFHIVCFAQVPGSA